MASTESNKTIPNHIVLELIGCFSFSKNQESDVAIAENIASISYSSLEALKATLVSSCTTDTLSRKVEKDFINTLKTSDWLIGELTEAGFEIPEK